MNIECVPWEAKLFHFRTTTYQITIFTWLVPCSYFIFSWYDSQIEIKVLCACTWRRKVLPWIVSMGGSLRILRVPLFFDVFGVDILISLEYYMAVIGGLVLFGKCTRNAGTSPKGKEVRSLCLWPTILGIRTLTELLVEVFFVSF